MQKLRICFIQTNIYSLFNEENNSIHGGSELQLYLIAKELSKNDDFKISFITGDFGQKNIENYHKIQLFKSFTPKSNDSLLKKLFQAIIYYRLFKEINADIYFTSAANSTIGLVSLFCKINNKNHIHRTASESEVNLSYKNKGILGKIFLYGLENANIVVTQNEQHRNLLKINHNINAYLFRNSFIIPKNDLETNKEFFLWVSRYDSMKKPQIFVELAERFPRNKFVLICPPAAERQKEWDKFRDEIDKRNLTNLTFIEKVPFNDIQKYFNKAKVFVNTSDYEGFPNTFLQAGIGKTPVLSLNVNPDNFINEYNCGSFCENDFNELVENAKTLINNEKVWKEKSENIFKYTKENHDIYKNVEQLTRMIYDLGYKK
jgi:glycosyltransferase involved in cell wall biosynthesis